MMELQFGSDEIDVGALSPEINELLQQGIVAYRRDRATADRLFREALQRAPHELATYFCLYKIHTYMGSLDFAAEVAWDGLREAARQAGWPEDPAQWPSGAQDHDGPARFALFTLKALSFIELKRDRRDVAMEHLGILSHVDPRGHVGWTVIADLARGVA
jgi:hypothetical protein